MNELKISERFRLICHGGFRPLNEAEREKLNTLARATAGI